MYAKNTNRVHCCFSFATMITLARHSVTLSRWYSATSLLLPRTQLLLVEFSFRRKVSVTGFPKQLRTAHLGPVASARDYFFFPQWPNRPEVHTVPYIAYDSLSQAEQLLGNGFYHSHISQKLRMRGAVPSLLIGIRDLLLNRTLTTAL